MSFQTGGKRGLQRMMVAIGGLCLREPVARVDEPRARGQHRGLIASALAEHAGDHAVELDLEAARLRERAECLGGEHDREHLCAAEARDDSQDDQ